MRVWLWAKQQGWKCLLFASLMSATVTLATQLLLRNLYRFLTFDQDFYQIFAQIADADMAVPVLAIFIVSFFYCMLGGHWQAAGTGGTVAAVLVGIVVWLVLWVAALFFTEVNQIRFGDVLISLLDMIQKGALEQL